jgi:hypothetical protein
MASFEVQQSALCAYREMARSQSGFALLIERLRAYENPDLIADILASPDVPAGLRCARLLQWAAQDPDNEFAHRSAARALAAAGRHADALGPIQRWLRRQPQGVEANALMAECCRNLGRSGLAETHGQMAKSAAVGDLTAAPGFLHIAAAPKLRDFARTFRAMHGCPYHIEASGQTLIHFHPSRTGGTSLRDGFRNLYDAGEVFVFGDFREPYLKSRQDLIDAAGTGSPASITPCRRTIFLPKNTPTSLS